MAERSDELQAVLTAAAPIAQWWAFVEAGAVCDGDEMRDDHVALHYMGNGASTRVTVGDLRAFCAALANTRRAVVTLPSPSYQGTQEGEPTVERLMALVDDYAAANHLAGRDGSGMERFGRRAIQAYAEALSRPHSETQQPSDGGKA